MHVEDGKYTIDDRGKPVIGMAWMENKIYVTCKASNRVHVFPDADLSTTTKEELIEIQHLDGPWDMAASTRSGSIFISDWISRCLWRIQMPSKEIELFEIYGQPGSLSVTTEDKLIVVVGRTDFYLDIFRCSDVILTHSIQMPKEVKFVCHAVATTCGNFIISYKNNNLVCMIAELSSMVRSSSALLNLLQLNQNYLPCIWRSMQRTTYSWLTRRITWLFC